MWYHFKRRECFEKGEWSVVLNTEEASDTPLDLTVNRSLEIWLEWLCSEPCGGQVTESSCWNGV